LAKENAKQKFVLSIAGFDPSGGAGLLQDLGAFRSAGLPGKAVATCLTAQSDLRFERLDWTAEDMLLEQLKVILKDYEIVAAKIGLINSDTQLPKVLELLRNQSQDKNIPVAIDPILKASRGFEFNSAETYVKTLSANSSSNFLLTPNYQEALELFGNKEALSSASESFPILVKSWPSETDIGDRLFQNSEIIDFNDSKARTGSGCPKHGSGCFLSAAIAAHLGNGDQLTEAITKAKGLFDSTFLNPASA